MKLKIALAGNPNSGKTTLFNALTGSNQFVGNWPGVTVEKKEGKLKGHKNVLVTDLPGVNSLSPYSLEEVITRDYLLDEKPDVILNIVDATNLERNLYLSTQLLELDIPVVIALNMMDVMRKNKESLNLERLSKVLGCPVLEISAINGEGVDQAADRRVFDHLGRCGRMSALRGRCRLAPEFDAVELGPIDHVRFEAIVEVMIHVRDLVGDAQKHDVRRRLDGKKRGRIGKSASEFSRRFLPHYHMIPSRSHYG